MTTSATAFAVAFIALYAGHHLGDYWAQTGHQAGTKGRPGWAGRRACTAHVLTLTATQAALLAAAHFTLGVRFGYGPVLAGLSVNAVTHWWADRRSTLAWLARCLGKTSFYGFTVQRAGFVDPYGPGTGAGALDQSWHLGWLFASALVVAGLG